MLDAVRRTKRLVIVDEDTPRCSVATDIAARRRRPRPRLPGRADQDRHRRPRAGALQRRRWRRRSCRRRRAWWRRCARRATGARLMAVERAAAAAGRRHAGGHARRVASADGARSRRATVIYRLETDKVSLEVESPASGVLRQLAAAGAVVPVNGLLGQIGEGGRSPPTPSSLRAAPPNLGGEPVQAPGAAAPDAAGHRRARRGRAAGTGASPSPSQGRGGRRLAAAIWRWVGGRGRSPGVAGGAAAGA